MWFGEHHIIIQAVKIAKISINITECLPKRLNPQSPPINGILVPYNTKLELIFANKASFYGLDGVLSDTLPNASERRVKISIKVWSELQTNWHGSYHHVLGTK